MPKAEVGSTKYVANQMKAKGLQRLRWYCQICSKQCRDENGFKQHTMSESHVRGMLQVGEDPKKYINEYSNQFKRDFLQLLKTSHGEKKVHMNNFYQEYIRDKEHVHMNSTKWPSLTEFAKFLGKEGVCRVEEGERGLEIAFIDDSPEAVARREDVKRKERQAKGDEDLESKLLNQQIKRAKEAAREKERLEAETRRDGSADAEKKEGTGEVVVAEPVKLSLSLGAKGAQKAKEPAKEQLQAEDAPVSIDTFSAQDSAAAAAATVQSDKPSPSPAAPSPAPSSAPTKISLGGLMGKKVNPLMGKKPNALAGKKPVAAPEPEKKMSNAERIMREEMERKRFNEGRGGGGKRQRLG
jgi:DNA/RNA-binding protein KIN17